MILRRNRGFVFTLERPKRKLLQHQTTKSNMIPKWKEQSLNPSIFLQASHSLNLVSIWEIGAKIRRSVVIAYAAVILWYMDPCVFVAHPGPIMKAARGIEGG